MSNIAVCVENLSKLYHIGKAQQRHDTLRDALVASLRVPLERLRRAGRGPDDAEDTIWALRDVSFEVHRGEVVGIIGRNGAGKSTLLKILSRITEPTAGRAVIKGRVGSLLEVGTGFHPELTGRENIYLNGAILGMRKVEIGRKFDEIVAFAEIEKFLDTPVKRYSSGMYVRLAFAVAAHLEPEILLVDEVLAVGDASFQKKCLGKMGDVAKEGRTVLFVSHNMAAVRKLCGQAILLTGGRMKTLGEVDEAVTEYESEVLVSQDSRSYPFPVVNHQYGLALESGKADIVRQERHVHLLIEVQLRSQERLSRVGIGIWIYTYDGFPIAKLGPGLTNNVIEVLDGRCWCVLEARNIEKYLAGGEYRISIAISRPKIERLIFAENVAAFRVPALDVYGSGVPCESTRYGTIPLPIRLTEVRMHKSDRPEVGDEEV